jgi:hypothetical protein
MAFCMSCGAPVDGAFCTKCGAQIGSSGGPGAQPRESAPAVPPISLPSPTATAPRKHSALLWILGGCLGLVVIAGIIAVSTGIFIAHKAGLDPALMKKDPGLAVAKMLASSNPDIEVLSVDEDRSIIRVRDKKTGKTMTMNLEDAKNGKIVFEDDQNKQVEIQTRGEGEDAAVEIKSAEGIMRMGAAASVQLPDWLPSYPGAEGTGTFSVSGAEGKAGSCAFKTSDSVDDVASFYEAALKEAGFEVQKTTTQIPGQGTLIMLGGTDKDGHRTAHVTAAASGEGTTINLVFEAAR